VTTTNGWFAGRPSGTESIYKIYAESFKDRAHLDAILHEAQEIVNNTIECRRLGPANESPDTPPCYSATRSQ
jgi:phosphoglucomutase